MQVGANYVRNSVKVTIDDYDYDGSMRFYLIQPADPILQVWMQLYPTLFTPLDQPPPGLVAYFRYPGDLLNSQATLLATYHMTDRRRSTTARICGISPRKRSAIAFSRCRRITPACACPASPQRSSRQSCHSHHQVRSATICWPGGWPDPISPIRAARRLPLPAGQAGIRSAADRRAHQPGAGDLVANDAVDQQGSQVLRGNVLVIPRM